MSQDQNSDELLAKADDVLQLMQNELQEGKLFVQGVQQQIAYVKSAERHEQLLRGVTGLNYFLYAQNKSLSERFFVQTTASGAPQLIPLSAEDEAEFIKQLRQLFLQFVSRSLGAARAELQRMVDLSHSNKE